MKLYQACICIICMLIVACSSRNQKVTDEGLLTEDELMSTLVELHLLDATIASYNAGKENPISLSQAFYDSLFMAHHDCTDSIFKESVRYYTLEGKIQAIYDKAIDSLNTLRIQLENKNRAVSKSQNVDTTL